MPISVGHCRSTSPSSVVKTWQGRFSTFPPFSAPRIAVHQPFLANASVSRAPIAKAADRKSTRLNSSHVKISYAVFCLKKKKKTQRADVYVKYNIKTSNYT